MLLDEKIQDLQNLIKRKISYTEIAPILGLGSKQAVQNRITRKQKLKEWEILALDEKFLKNNKINHPSDSENDIIELERVEGISPECGAGLEVYSEPHLEPFRISKQSVMSYLRCTSPENLKIFKATGDSMEHKISDGDWLLVDVGRREAATSGVYIFTANGLLRCKRLNTTLDGKLEVKSDNTKYKDEIITEKDNIEIVIIGRVLNNLSKSL